MSEDNYDLERVVEEPTLYKVVGRMGKNAGSSVYHGAKVVLAPVGGFIGGYFTMIVGIHAIPTIKRINKECIYKEDYGEEVMSNKPEFLGMIVGFAVGFASFLVGYTISTNYSGNNSSKGEDSYMNYLPLLPFATNALSFLYEIGRKSFQATKQELIAENKERVVLKEPMNPISGLSYPTDDSLDGQLSDATTNTKPILERLREDDSLEGKVGYNNKQTESTTG